LVQATAATTMSRNRTCAAAAGGAFMSLSGGGDWCLLQGTLAEIRTGKGRGRGMSPETGVCSI
jgi:hypothetical protein